jgi:hypothetical protein
MKRHALYKWKEASDEKEEILYILVLDRENKEK